MSQPEVIAPPPPPAAAEPEKRPNGLGVAAMVVGIVAIAGAFIPFINIVSVILGFVALALGVVALILKGRRRGTAIAGVVLGGLAIIIGISVLAATSAAIDGALKDSDVGTSVEGPAAEEPLVEEPAAEEPAVGAPAGGTVTYEVTSDAATASNVTFMTFNDGGSGSEQVTDAALPFTSEATVSEGAFDVNIFSLVAQATADATTITCRISYNGEVISEQTSTGAFSVVSCSDSN